ncbi:hypothetical protein TYRP_020317 [Tyrophagus putrescentiae]|nr:hypothetical protein TYRP_020317 [Tyrophagus putrescentiae]
MPTASRSQCFPPTPSKLLWNLLLRLTEKDRLKLVHAGVGEEEAGIVGWGSNRAGTDEGVPVLVDKVVDEGLADLLVGVCRGG